MRNRLVGNANARAYRHIGIAWLGAITLGAACILVLSGGHQDSQAPSPVATSKAADPTAIQPQPASSPAVDPAPVVENSITGFKEPTEAELAKQRVAVSKALGLTNGLSRGVWITRSTLSVDRTIPEAQAWPLVCREVELYPYLRTIRVQLNPPPGSGEAVRWRQCKTM